MDNEEGMFWQTADFFSADTTDVSAADTTDVLPADTTHVLPADNPGFLWKNQKSCNPHLGILARKKLNLSMGGWILLGNIALLRGTRYSKALRTWVWISLGLVVLDVSRKVSDFFDPCFQNILVSDFGWVLTFGSDLPKM